MPGVLQVEAMAQAAGILAIKNKKLSSDSSIYFMTMDKVKFRKAVRPGDKIIIKVDIQRDAGARISFQGRAYVEETLVSEASMVAMIIPKHGENPSLIRLTDKAAK